MDASPPNRRRARAARGQSLLELALALPALLILLFVLVNTAAIIRAWQALQQAALAGVRAAALTRDPAYAGGIVLANLKPFGDPSDPRFPIYAIYSTGGAALQPRNPHHPPPGAAGVYCHSVALAAILNEATPALAGDDTAGHLAQYSARYSGQCPAAEGGDRFVTVALSYEARVAGPFLPGWTVPLKAQATARIEDGP